MKNFHNTWYRKKKWILLDAKGQNLGRFTSKIIKIIRGKHKSNYTTNINCGDNIIIINIKDIKLTGNKWTKKKYISHTGYPGGQKKIYAKNLSNKDPRILIKKAIKGMLPKNKLKNKLIKNLFLYKNSNHKFEYQKFHILNIKNI
jgi:large subunit ribosomal protein L13